MSKHFPIGEALLSEFKEDVSKIDNPVTYIKPDPLFLVEFEPLSPMLWVDPDAPIGIDDPVPRNVFLTVLPSAAEDTGDTL